MVSISNAAFAYNFFCIFCLSCFQFFSSHFFLFLFLVHLCYFSGLANFALGCLCHPAPCPERSPTTLMSAPNLTSKCVRSTR